MKKINLLTGIILFALSSVAVAQDAPASAAAKAPAAAAQTASPEGAKVYIISPENGATVAPTFTVQFGLKGMGIAPAGIEKENTGHHHLLVDGKEAPAADKPMGPEIKHFGGGQTETELTLEPGEHTLQLILGDKTHTPLNPSVESEKVTITVEAAKEEAASDAKKADDTKEGDTKEGDAKEDKTKTEDKKAY